MEQEKQWPKISLPEQVNIAERHGIDTLLYCADSWAIRHHWINRETGEVQRARCNRWECLYCGARKVDLWRQLVLAAEPTLFLTLTKAGTTVQEAARALTTFVQALRRGSKGKGPLHVGARSPYAVEYFAVLERHKDFERNGFHWHLLMKGVESIPYKEVIQPLWMSATHYRPSTEQDAGRGAKIARIERIRNAKAIGYVTKYLTKAVAVGEKGVKQVQKKQMVTKLEEQGRSAFTIAHDELGQVVREEQVSVEEVASKAHRIRYSRDFFPESVAELRKRLFAGLEKKAIEPGESEAGVVAQEKNGLPLEPDEGQEDRGPLWILKEKEEFTNDVEEYRLRRRKMLLSVIKEMNSGTVHLSRRVIGVWAYQRGELERIG